MTTPGAACPVCGGSCKSFPDIEYPASYPFLPGGTVAKQEDTVKADARLFDEDGVLRYIAGDNVPKSELKSLSPEKAFQGADQRQVEDEQANEAAEASQKRAPARESR